MRFMMKFRKSRRWWINGMKDRCSHKSHNTRARCHCVKVVGESFKTGKGKHFVRLLPQRVVEAGSKGCDKGMCMKGI